LADRALLTPCHPSSFSAISGGRSFRQIGYVVDLLRKILENEVAHFSAPPDRPKLGRQEDLMLGLGGIRRSSSAIRRKASLGAFSLTSFSPANC
jgi:hypothetical protein